jgi:hypothetical protein
MNKSALFGVVQDLLKLGGSYEVFARRFLSSNKPEPPKPEETFNVCYLDLTKMGRLTQQGLNGLLDYLSWVLNMNATTSIGVVFAPLLASETLSGGLRGEIRHPLPITPSFPEVCVSRCCATDRLMVARRLEDGCVKRQMELRQIALTLNTQKLHGNRDISGLYPGWLVVMDSVTPTKGVDHRSKKEVDKEAGTASSSNASLKVERGNVTRSSAVVATSPLGFNVRIVAQIRKSCFPIRACHIPSKSVLLGAPSLS